MRRRVPRARVQRRGTPPPPARQGPRDRGAERAEANGSSRPNGRHRVRRAVGGAGRAPGPEDPRRGGSSVDVVEAASGGSPSSTRRSTRSCARADDALDRARRGRRRQARGSVDGPLHGVPFTIKDSLDTAGLVTTAGTVGWRDRVPDRDATVVARLKAAGGILLGQDEHARVHLVRRDRQRRLRADVEPVRPDADAGRQLRRPRRDRRCRRRRRSTSAATPATASASRPTSAGSPGSSRRADACRGRATGRRSRGSPASPQLGPMARRVEDLALLLPIIAGPDGDDPHVVPVAARRPGRGRRSGASGRRIHRQRDPDADAGDRRAVERAVAALAATGAAVDWQVPPAPSRGMGAWDRRDPQRRPRLAPATDHRGRHPGMGSYDTRGWVTRSSRRSARTS